MKKVLVVDDDLGKKSSITFLFKEYEEDWGIEFSFITDPDQFLALGSDINNYDLILMDNHFEGHDLTGSDLACTTRKSSVSIPIVMISSCEEYCLEGIRAGANDFVNKIHLFNDLKDESGTIRTLINENRPVLTDCTRGNLIQQLDPISIYIQATEIKFHAGNLEGSSSVLNSLYTKINNFSERYESLKSTLKPIIPGRVDLRSLIQDRSVNYFFCNLQKNVPADVICRHEWKLEKVNNFRSWLESLNQELIKIQI